MKAILLAGGKGTRISRFIQDMPKSTLPIGNKPLIRHTIEKFLSKNIQVIVCTGYKEEEIRKSLSGLNVSFYYNPFYSVTNSLGTLWFALKEFTDDLIIMNADVYFDDKILDSIINCKFPVVMAADSSRCETGDYFLKTNNEHCVVKYGKDLPLCERSSEYVGMAKVSKSFMPKFINQFNHMIKNGEFDKWWENILYSLADSGESIRTIDYKDYFWGEVDFYDDYLKIINHING